MPNGKPQRKAEEEEAVHGLDLAKLTKHPFACRVRKEPTAKTTCVSQNVGNKHANKSCSACVLRCIQTPSTRLSQVPASSSPTLRCRTFFPNCRAGRVSGHDKQKCKRPLFQATRRRGLETSLVEERAAPHKIAATRLEAIASRLEAIASRLEAIAISRLGAIASRLEAIASRLEAIAISRLGAIASRLEDSRLEAIAISRLGGHR